MTGHYETAHPLSHPSWELASLGNYKLGDCTLSLPKPLVSRTNLS